jgi:hypothetical protein
MSVPNGTPRRSILLTTQPSIEDLVLGAFPWIPKVKLHRGLNQIIALGSPEFQTFQAFSGVATVSAVLTVGFRHTGYPSGNCA